MKCVISIFEEDRESTEGLIKKMNIINDGLKAAATQGIASGLCSGNLQVSIQYIGL